MEWLTILWWFLVLYTLASVVWAISQLGYKHKAKEPWWEQILFLPAMIIALCLGAFTILSEPTKWPGYIRDLRVKRALKKEWKKTVPLGSKLILEMGGNGRKVNDAHWIRTFEFGDDHYGIFRFWMTADKKPRSRIEIVGKENVQRLTEQFERWASGEDVKSPWAEHHGKPENCL